MKVQQFEVCGDICLDWDPELVGEIAEYGEDDEAGQEGGEGVRHTDDQGIPVGVMRELQDE